MGRPEVGAFNDEVFPMYFMRRLLSPLIVSVLALGCSGDDGAVGPAGPAGADGTDGRDGRDGVDGVDGTNGRDGVDGHDGVDGNDGVSGEPPAALEGSGRLAIADATEPGIRMLDLETGRIVATFSNTLPGASLYATESGRIIGVVQSPEDDAAGRIDFIDSGLELDAKGGRNTQLPRMLENSLVAAQLDTARPVHFVSHGGYVTAHFDGIWSEDAGEAVEAANYVFREADLLEPGATPLELRTESQHGVSVVSLVSAEGHVILTAPTQSRDVSTLPSGFTVHALEDGELLQTIQDEQDFEASCIGMHGEAAIGHQYLFGCHERFDGGILVMEYDEASGEYSSRKLRYPGFDMDGDPRAPARTSSMTTHPASPYALGQYGHYTGGVSHYSGLIRIDPEKTQLEEDDTLDLGSVYCNLGFEQREGRLVAALTVDGRLHVAELEDFSGYKTLQILPDGGETCPGQMTLGDGVAYVARAGQGVILEVDLTSLEVRRSFDVGGEPSSVALASFRLPLEP